MGPNRPASVRVKLTAVYAVNSILGPASSYRPFLDDCRSDAGTEQRPQELQLGQLRAAAAARSGSAVVRAHRAVAHRAGRGETGADGGPSAGHEFVERETAVRQAKDTRARGLFRRQTSSDLERIARCRQSSDAIWGRDRRHDTFLSKPTT